MEYYSKLLDQISAFQDQLNEGIEVQNLCNSGIQYALVKPSCLHLNNEGKRIFEKIRKYAFKSGNGVTYCECCKNREQHELPREWGYYMTLCGPFFDKGPCSNLGFLGCVHLDEEILRNLMDILHNEKSEVKFLFFFGKYMAENPVNWNFVDECFEKMGNFYQNTPADYWDIKSEMYFSGLCALEDRRPNLIDKFKTKYSKYESEEEDDYDSLDDLVLPESSDSDDSSY